MLTINAGDLPRFMACNGSRKMPVAIPASANDTTQRDEGIAAHFMAAAVFNGQHTLEELIDRKAPNGVFMTAEMAQHVQGYLDVCLARITGKMEVDTSHDFSPHWVVNGRADFVALAHNSGDLTVFDFKYGWRIVEPEKNWTLISHAIGHCRQSQFTPPSSITLGVFQPRPYHPDGALRTVTITYDELKALFEQLSAALSNPSDMLNTNSFCGTCQANPLCPAARRAEMNAIDACDTVFSDTISNELLSFNLDNLNRAQDMIKQRLAAFGELAKHRITAGQVVENYSVKMGLGNAVFKDGLNGPMLKILTGVDMTIEKLCTPAEGIRRGVSKEVMATLTTRPNTGVQLERVKASKKAERLLG